MSLISPPILVAAATPVNFTLRNRRTSCNVQVRFYTDAAGTVEMGTRGTGTRDLTATNSSSGYQGSFSAPTAIGPFTSNINGGAITAMISETWYELGLGSGMGQLTLVAVANVNAPGSASYRIIVDSEGDSSV
jgi:hypothetical protein